MKKISTKNLLTVFFFMLSTLLFSGLLMLNTTKVAYADIYDAYGLSYTYDSGADSYQVSGCNKTVTSIVIPATYDDGTNEVKNVTKINDNVFSTFDTLTTVSFEAGSVLTTIGSYAFNNCYALSSITLPNSLISIGNNCFWGCTTLSSITIPANVSFIGADAFRNTDALAQIVVNGSNTTYKDNNDDCILTIDGTTLLKYASANASTIFGIPTTVTTIQSYAFNDANFSTVTIPSSVATIESQAFLGSKITSITIPSTVTSLGDATFHSCKSLTSATINTELTTLPSSLFAECSVLAEVTLPNSITTIGNNCFIRCELLTTINFPSSLTSIGEYAFGFTKLGIVILPTTVNSVGQSAFYSCSSMTSINIPNVTTINNSTFYNCSNLNDFVFPSSLVSIGDSAFSGCTSLPNSIKLPNMLTSIGINAFSNTQFQKILIPTSVTSIPTSEDFESPFNGNLNVTIYCKSSEAGVVFGEFWNNVSEYQTIPTYWDCFGITFNEGDVYTGTQLTDLTNQDVVPSLEPITQEGYQFKGWYYDEIHASSVYMGQDLFEKATDSNSVTLYAWLDPISYSVTFNGNGSNEGEMLNQGFIYGKEQALYENEFSRTGYAFLGWGTSFDGVVVYDDKEIVSNLTTDESTAFTLFAIWQVETYTVTYNFGGGEYSPNDDKFDSQQYDYNTTIYLPNSSGLEKDGYGFYRYNDGTQDYDQNASYTVVGDVTFTVTWEIQTYTITYNLYDGVNSGLNPATYNVETPTITLSNATKNRYTFGGWFTSSEFFEISRKTEIVPSSNIDGVTLYAKWTPIEYTITYHLNGGENNENNPTTYNIETETFSIQNPSKTGYTFSGWYADSSFMLGISTDINQGSFNEIEFYAKWTVNKYYVAFDKNTTDEVTGTMSNQQLTYDTTQNLSNNAFERLHYNFVGWALTSDATEKDYINEDFVLNLSSTSNDIVTLYAVWEIVKNTITYNSAGATVGTVPQQGSFDYNTTATVAGNTGSLSKQGYHFVSWNTLSNGSGTTFTPGQQFTITNDITLFAIYEPNPYVITLDVNGGDALEDNLIDINYADIVPTLPIATREGYYFVGWFYDSTEIVPNETVFGATENLIIVAHWALTYSITFDVVSGEEIEPMNKPAGSTIILPRPVRAGYAFDGWQVDATIYYANDNFTVPASAVTFIARWYANDYTISFNVNNGTGTFTPISATSGQAVSNLSVETPTRTGYTFEGWYYVEEGEDSVLVDSDYVFNFAEDITLTASWEVVTYTITYDLDNGINNVNNPATYDVEDEDITLSNPTKTGYTFEGWFTTDTFEASSQVTVIDTATLQSYSLYAQFEIVTYTITYNLDGGTNNVNNPATYDVEDEDITLSNPTKTGYTFEGWFTTDTFEASSQVTVIDTATLQSYSLYAQFEIVTYTITYDLDGGINNVNNPATYDVEDEDITLSNPTKTGYTFEGWFTTDTFEASSQVTVIDTATLQSYSLYAQFEIVTYTITYDLDGGINNVNNPATYDVEDEDITLSNATKTGYTFEGWFTTDTFEASSQVVVIDIATLQSYALYAQFEIITYTITYDLDGGTNSINNPATYDVEDEDITLSNATKTGYTFEGWYSDEDLSNMADTTIETGSTGNLTFYAKWEIKNITISFEIGGGIVQADITGDFNSLLTLPTPTRAGYTFKGWFYDEEFENPVTELNLMPSEDLVLYAMWEEVPTNYVLYYAIGGAVALLLIVVAIYFITKPKKSKGTKKAIKVVNKKDKKVDTKPQTKQVKGKNKQVKKDDVITKVETKIIETKTTETKKVEPKKGKKENK